MTFVLVITQSTDLTVDYLVKHYNESVQWLRIDVDQFGRYCFEVRNNCIQISDPQSGWKVCNNEIQGLLYRKPALPNLSEYNPYYIPMMQKEILSLVEGIAETSGEICLTRPSILRRAENKIVQMNLATLFGFKLSQSLITNVAESADKFIESKPSVVKPLSTGLIRTKKGIETIQTNMVVSSESVDNISLSPTYFQHYVEKLDGEYRVTIIGKSVFAVRIDSTNKVDWRRKGAVNDYRVVEFPQRVLDQCFKLMNHLNLAYSAFDFIKVGQEYIFLEVNPNGQWLWLEQMLNIPISRKIVEHLIKGTCLNE